MFEDKKLVTKNDPFVIWRALLQETTMRPAVVMLSAVSLRNRAFRDLETIWYGVRTGCENAVPHPGRDPIAVAEVGLGFF